MLMFVLYCVETNGCKNLVIGGWHFNTTVYLKSLHCEVLRDISFHVLCENMVLNMIREP